MNVEIINTSPEKIPPELDEAIRQYAVYHIFEEQRNRVVIESQYASYDLRAAFVKVDENHITVWISNWTKTNK